MNENVSQKRIGSWGAIFIICVITVFVLYYSHRVLADLDSIYSAKKGWGAFTAEELSDEQQDVIRGEQPSPYDEN